jgi:hypothetical protein
MTNQVRGLEETLEWVYSLYEMYEPNESLVEEYVEEIPFL